MIILQYILIVIAAVGAIAWLFRKQLFPSKKSTGCGTGDCGCH